MIEICVRCGKEKLDSKDDKGERLVCYQCKKELFAQWQKEDNIPGGGIIFHTSK